ncbi:MAG: hypothetical protein GEV11_27490 [Streptosporangiales bacterium]|nr:hypothetical protein [Streptosporangiales bacterium]
MSIRYTKTLLAGAAALVLATGCGLVQGEEKTGASATPSGGQSSGAAPNAGPTRPAAAPVAGRATPAGQSDLNATINSFKADGAGFGTLTYTLKNVGSSDYQVSGPLASEATRYLSVQPNNVQVQDDQAKVIQYTLADTSRNCLCFWTDPSSDYFYLEPGDEVMFSNMYQISDQAQTVTVIIPGFQPVKGVKVERP